MAANDDLRVFKLYDDFEKINQIMKMECIKNFNLMKLLYYPEVNPLSMSMDEELADLISTEYFTKTINGKLQQEKNPECRLTLEPFDPDAVVNTVSLLHMYINQLSPEDIFMGNLFIQVDIVVHQDISKIVTGRRRDAILREVINTLNGKALNVGIQPLSILQPIRLMQFKNSYWGYTMFFNTKLATRGGVCPV